MNENLAGKLKLKTENKCWNSNDIWGGNWSLHVKSLLGEYDLYYKFKWNYDLNLNLWYNVYFPIKIKNYKPK